MKRKKKQSHKKSSHKFYRFFITALLAEIVRIVLADEGRDEGFKFVIGVSAIYWTLLLISKFQPFGSVLLKFGIFEQLIISISQVKQTVCL